jgi:hypothetical protein
MADNDDEQEMTKKAARIGAEDAASKRTQTGG